MTRKSSIGVKSTTLAKFNYIRTIEGLTADKMLQKMIEIYEKKNKEEN